MKRIFFSLIVIVLTISIGFNSVLAEEETSAPIFQQLGDVSFYFPTDINLTESVTNNSSNNIFSFVDDDFSTITGTCGNIYHTIKTMYPDLNEEQINNKFPQENIWTNCGLFEDTWADYDYVFNYLTESVNSGSVVYECEMSEITLNSIPFYKFIFKVGGEMENPPGGIIYLTVFKSNQYIIQFCNFLDFETTVLYSEAFEQSIRIEGSESYEFVTFDLTEVNTSQNDIYIALIVFGVVLFIILIPAIIINTKRFKND